MIINIVGTPLFPKFNIIKSMDNLYDSDGKVIHNVDNVYNIECRTRVGEIVISESKVVRTYGDIGNTNEVINLIAKCNQRAYDILFPEEALITIL